MHLSCQMLSAYPTSLIFSLSSDTGLDAPSDTTMELDKTHLQWVQAILNHVRTVFITAELKWLLLGIEFMNKIMWVIF